MPFITLTGGLTIKVPTRGTTNWDSVLLSDTFQKISEHDHSGGGNGAQLGAGSIADDSIDDRKIRLRNNEYLRARNNAGTADVDILKINLSDNLELAPLIDLLRMSNDVNIVARNFADTADLPLIKLDTNDEVILGGATSLTDILDDIIDLQMTVGTGSMTQALVNNQAAPANVTGVNLTPGTDEGAMVDYRIFRDGTADLRESGTLHIYYDGTNYNIVKEYHGDDESGVDFSFSGGQLQYTTTDNSGSVLDEMYYRAAVIGA